MFEAKNIGDALRDLGAEDVSSPAKVFMKTYRFPQKVDIDADKIHGVLLAHRFVAKKMYMFYESDYGMKANVSYRDVNPFHGTPTRESIVQFVEINH
mgnify:CR=1 FL=1